MQLNRGKGLNGLWRLWRYITSTSIVSADICGGKKNSSTMSHHAFQLNHYQSGQNVTFMASDTETIFVVAPYHPKACF